MSVLDKMARAMWVADGFNEYLWDAPFSREWEIHMNGQKSLYFEKATKLLVTMSDEGLKVEDSRD